MNNISIERGRALVLVGPQGSGKSTLAREIAQGRGPYREIIMFELGRPFQTWVGEPVCATVIVDGFPESPDLVEEVKRHVVNEQMEMNRKGREIRLVRTPDLIFCALSVPKVSEGLRNRLFVFDMRDAE